MTHSVRTRFAPSPTGFQHVGNIRTGLFAWLTARHYGGQFILRLEDTDKKREVQGAATHLVTTLKTLGIDWDEGIEKGGPYAPYVQSERLAIYRAWAQKLIDEGRAYTDPYTPEEVQAFREQAQAEKRAFLYRNHRPENPPAWDGTRPLRFKSDPKAYAWHDTVMGDLSTGPEVIDDFVLMKSDGFPTYNFCHIVDDAEMKVTHILRGTEFISSTPNYLNLYEALHLTPPTFVTMPHVMNEHGNKKLSKRDGAKDILDYVREGFLPETLLGFIATLGWNDGTTQEVFTRQELIEKFSLERVQKSGARFDEKRLLWMNGQFIRAMNIDELYKRTSDFWPASARDASIERKKELLVLVHDRLKTFADLPLLTEYFFTAPAPDWTMLDNNKQLKKLEPTEIRQLLVATKTALKAIEFDANTLQATLNTILEQTKQKPGILFSLIRLSVSWAPFSPALNDTLAALGKEETLVRIDTALHTLEA